MIPFKLQRILPNDPSFRDKLFVPTDPAYSVRPTLYLPSDRNELSSLDVPIPVFTIALDPNTQQPTAKNVSAQWSNNLGFDIGIKSGLIWIGADSAGSGVFSGRADIPYIVLNMTTGVIIWWSNWDHYIDIGDIWANDKTFDWGNQYVRIRKNDVLYFSAGGAGPYPPDMYPVSIQANLHCMWRRAA